MLESNPLPAPKLGLVEAPQSAPVDVLVIGLPTTGQLSPTASRIDQALEGWLSRLIERDELRGRLGDLSLLAAPRSDGPAMILVVGIGDDPLARNAAFNSAAMALRRIADRPRNTIAIALAENFDPAVHDAVVSGALYGCEGQAIYQSEPPLTVPQEIQFSGIAREMLQRGAGLGQSINLTRRLVNEPPAMIFPESFAQRVSELASEVGLGVEVWDEHKLAAEGCRAILAVGAGSSKPPRLVILRHAAGGSQPPILLVGKGVTFDSGGLSLKPSEAMADMKCDMAGAATVVGVMHALAKLGIKRNVIGLCGLAENMVSGSSYKLGDVIETRSGKTIEILNTDAEGRVVLADTLDVAIQFKPAAMVDLATLTGACMVALGNEVAGLMTNHQETCDALRTAAEAEGEPVWQLPMFPLYDEKVKSKVADIKNVGEGRWGGAITAAKFLEQFVGETPWVHIDIAGPAFAEQPKPERDAGATGCLVRTLVRWIE